MAFHRAGMGTWAGRLVVGLGAATLLASFALAGQASAPPSKAGEFDVPIKEVSVDLGRDPDDPTGGAHDILSCSYFPQLLVKEVDTKGDLGSKRLSILRSRDTLPACTPSHEPGERVLKWDGYFWGVKAGLAFFSCIEFAQGSCSFAVYASTSGKKLFTDDVAVSAKDLDIHMQVFSTKAGVVARYVAAAQAGCDLYKSADCWKKVKARFGLKGDRRPDCSGYPQVYERFQIDEDESMIGYPVEVTFSSRPAVKTVAGPIRCWPTI